MTAVRRSRPRVWPRVWPRVRLVAGAVLLGFLVWQFGTGPVVDAWRLTTWPAILAVLALTSVSTLAVALRWRVVAARLGVPLSPRASVAAYYRSQVLNVTLPGGVLGDADRAVRHGRGCGDLGAGVRATVWDRASGQAVQGAVVVVALMSGPESLQWLAPVVAAVGGLVVLVLLAVRRTTRRGAVLTRDLRSLATLDVVVPVSLASMCSTAAHVAVFFVAVHAVGVHASWLVLLPLSLFVLSASAVPLNVAGWGPREGVTAWAFSLSGLSATEGLTVAVMCGVLGTVATVPGLVVLAFDGLSRRRRTASAVVPPEAAGVPVPASEEAVRA